MDRLENTFSYGKIRNKWHLLLRKWFDVMYKWTYVPSWVITYQYKISHKFIPTLFLFLSSHLQYEYTKLPSKRKTIMGMRALEKMQYQCSSAGALAKVMKK